jgi:aspartate aminotransferase
MLYEMNEKVIKLEAEGRNIVKFNIGDPDQETPREIVEAAYEALRNGKTKYGSGAGEMKLREAVASIHDVSPDRVVITPGSKWAVFAIMCLLLKDGGNVIIPTPHWTAYELIAKNLGVEVRFLRTELDSNWQIGIEELGKLIDRQTKLLILCNPSNPTSVALKEKNLEEIVSTVDRRFTILSDEVYSDIGFVKTKSILDFDGDNALVKSFSKTFAMTGWRIGYSVTSKELAQKIVKLNFMSVTNVPVFIQEAALKALELRVQIAERMREEYRRRADLACEVLSKTRLQFAKPDAPFYLFPKYESLDSERFALNLLDQGVAVTPGTAFGDYWEYFRIALTLPGQEILRGLDRICRGIEESL